jgi:hypothetical protein
MIGLSLIPLARGDNAVTLRFVVVYPPLFQRGVRGDFLNKSPSIPLFQRGKLLKLNDIARRERGLPFRFTTSFLEKGLGRIATKIPPRHDRQ